MPGGNGISWAGRSSEGTFRVPLTARRPKIMVSDDGTGLISQAGGLLLAQALGATGLDRGWTQHWNGGGPSGPSTPQGRSAPDPAVAVTLAGNCLADVAIVRAQPGLMTADPVVSRLVTRLAADVSRALKAIRAAGAVARRRPEPGRRPCVWRTG